MLFYKKIVRCVTLSLFILSLSAFAVADTIRLKDGSIIKGKIVSFGGGKFTVAIGEGSRKKQMTFTADVHYLDDGVFYQELAWATHMPVRPPQWRAGPPAPKVDHAASIDE